MSMQGEPIEVPPPIPWTIQVVKLATGDFLLVIQTPNAAFRFACTQEQLKKLAANLYQASSGIVVPQNGHNQPPTAPLDTE
jgi:hypothetical protein